MSMLELQNNVAKKFFTFTDPSPASVLSYWPPNIKELATGLTTPLVLLTNDGAVSYFFHHLALHESINLFVTFDSKRDKHPLTVAAKNPPANNHKAYTVHTLLYMCTITANVHVYINVHEPYKGYTVPTCCVHVYNESYTHVYIL